MKLIICGHVVLYVIAWLIQIHVVYLRALRSEFSRISYLLFIFYKRVILMNGILLLSHTVISTSRGERTCVDLLLAHPIRLHCEQLKCIFAHQENVLHFQHFQIKSCTKDNIFIDETK